MGAVRVLTLMAYVAFLIVSVVVGWLVLRFGPYSGYAHYCRALVWAEKKEYAKAIGEYDEAIRLDPRRAYAYVGRGDAWQEQKEFDKAIADYTEAIRLDPRSAIVYYDRARAWSGKNEDDKAIADYTEAIRLDPESPYAYYGRANVWIGKLEYDGAIADYSEAIRLNPMVAYALLDSSESTDDWSQPFLSILAYTYYGRGAAWVGKKDYDKALGDCNECLRLTPRLAAGYVCRGNVWQLKGQYEKALVDYSDSIRFDAEMSYAYGSRAWIWAACPNPRLRDGQKAIESATQACELTKWNDADSLDSLAAAYAEASDFNSAVKWQTKAIAAPTNLGENHEPRDPRLVYQQEQSAQRKLYRQDQRARLLLYQGKKPYRLPTP
jgi:tetratricopeptide (TPR) repeat protein